MAVKSGLYALLPPGCVFINLRLIWRHWDFPSHISQTFMFLLGSQFHYPRLIFNFMFILREIHHGFLNSVLYLLRTASWMLLPHYFSGTWCYKLSYIAIIDKVLSLIFWRKAFPFIYSSFTSTSLFVIWTPLSHFFLHFQLIVYFPHVCFNSRSLTRVRLSFQVCSTIFEYFTLLLPIWHVIIAFLSRAVFCLYPNPIF